MRYDRVIAYVLETPWAIRPEALGAILDVLRFRASGGKFTDEEVADRLAAAREHQAAVNSPRSAGGSVAVLPLYGSIFPRANLFTEMSGGTSLDKFGSVFRQLDSDPKVGHIVIDVASPGGSVEMVPETAEIIRQAATKVTAVANAEAASAAYWLAAQADEIVVTPSGAVGSIGVWSAHEDWSVHDANEGIRTTLISAGKYKVEGHPWEPLGEEARAAIQSDVDEFYGMFVNAVAEGRGVSSKAVLEGFGEGRMVLARDAVRQGMADRVATLDEVIGDITTATSSSLPAVSEFITDGMAYIEFSADPDDEPAAVAPPSSLVPGVERLLARPKIREVFRASPAKMPALSGGETERREP